MNNSSEFYFTHNEKIFAEHLNDTILLTNAFDLIIPIKMPSMFSDGAFQNTIDPRKCGMAIVTLNSELPSGISINSNGALTGSGTVAFKFYPNFNTFGCIKKINWTNTGSITVNLKKTDNTSIISSVTQNADISQNDELNKLQEIVIEVVFGNATLTELEIILENKKETRYGAKINMDNVDGLTNELENIEDNNTQQDFRLNNINNDNIQQNNRLNTIDSLDLKYFYSLSASNYNPLIDNDITITLTVTDIYGSAANNKNVTLYQNGNVVSTKSTNSSGIAEWTVDCNDWGRQDFSVNNTHCQVYVTGWREIATHSPIGGGTLKVLRNKTHGRLILDGWYGSVDESYYYDDNDIRHAWKKVSDDAFVRTVSPIKSTYFFATDYEPDLYKCKRVRALFKINVNDFKIHYCGVMMDSHNWLDRESWTWEGEVQYGWGNPNDWMYDETAINLDCQWAIRDELL